MTEEKKDYALGEMEELRDSIIEDRVWYVGNLARQRDDLGDTENSIARMNADIESLVSAIHLIELSQESKA